MKKLISTVGAFIIVASLVLSLVCCKSKNKNHGGLYDADGNLIVSFTESGMDVTKNYTMDSVFEDEASPYNVIENKYPNTVKILLPDGIERLGEYAFLMCERLTEIQLPEKIKVIPKGCFSSCSGLKELSVPIGTEEIAAGAFAHCSSLESVTLPSSLKVIGNSAFTNCFALSAIVIPEGVTTVGTGAFVNCTVLSDVTLPTSAENISFPIFRGRIKVADGNPSFSYYEDGIYSKDMTKLFYYYGGSMEDYAEFPPTVTEIGVYALEGSKSVYYITLHDGVTKISDYAFRGCGILEKVTVPASVTSIGSESFAMCTSLKTVSYSGTVAQWEEIEKASDWSYSTENFTVECSDGDIEY